MTSASTMLRPAPAGLLKDKVVMVCGVGPDLGRSLALQSARAGANVVLAARTSERLRQVADEVAEVGVKTLTVTTDVTDDAARAHLTDRALEEFGRVDVLLDSAFVHPPPVSMLDTDLDSMRSAHELNVLAAIDLVRRLKDTLVENQGSVVLVNSMVIRNRLPGNGVYRMTKGALLSAARSLSVELGPLGVRVNSIAPGYIWADKVRGNFERRAQQRGIDADQVYEEIADQTDLRRLPTPDEIADTAVFLASDIASGITGQCLDVNCGHAHN